MESTRNKNWKARLWPNLKSLASTIVFVWFFTQHIAQATVVPTGSMVPTILVGDHFMLDKVAFPANYPGAIRAFLPERTIDRSDIVAFWSPENPDLRLVKRVIGLPGETLAMREGAVFIDGEKLKEPYTARGPVQASAAIQNMAPITIPPDSFFMMGDNRDDSRDSRYFGVVKRDSLIGQPLFIYWSYDSSDPYPVDGTLRQWTGYYASVATHFLTRTRWARTGTVLR